MNSPFRLGLARFSSSRNIRHDTVYKGLRDPDFLFVILQTGSIETHEDMFQFPEEAVPTSSGYLPIRSKSKSRLFYVFYEATKSPTRIADTPILLWLNGGPGCSSLIGCYYELGPWRLTEKGKLEANNGAWNRR